MASKASKIDAQAGRKKSLFQGQIAGTSTEKINEKPKYENNMEYVDAIDLDHCLDETPATETKEGRGSATHQPLPNHSKGCSNADIPVETARGKASGTNAGIERGFASQSELMNGFTAGRAQREEERDRGGYPILTTLTRDEHLVTAAPGAFPVYPNRHTASSDNLFDNEDQHQPDTAPRTSCVSNAGHDQLQHVPEATMVQETPVVLAVKQSPTSNGAEDVLASRRCPWGCVLVSGLMLLLGVAAVISVAVVVVKNTNLHSSAEADNPLIFTLSPSISPTSLPSASLEPTLSPSNNFETNFIKLVQSRSPETHFLSNEVAAVLDWIVNDPYSLALAGNADRLLQRFALATVWFALGLDASSTKAALEAWLQPIDECDWYGRSSAPTPECNSDGVVVGLGLSGHALVGSIPVELILLSRLTHLGLQTTNTNSLTGTIPSQLDLLTSLATLRIGPGAMVGDIPAGVWTSLTNLKWLEIDSNPGMSPFSFPSDIPSLSRLTTLSLYAIGLSGSIPTQVGALTALVELDIAYNSGLIGSTIPTTIGLLSRLTMLNLQGNGLTGSIPTEIGLLYRLEHLFLGDNALTGALPTELQLLTSLTVSL